MEQSDDKHLKVLLKDLSNFSTRVVEKLHSSNSEGNLLVSPISIVNALALLLPGASGETYSQIQKVLGLKSFDSFDKIKKIFISLNVHLKNLKSTKIANAVAYHSKEKINPEYHKTLTSIFESEGFSFDFEHDSTQAASELNRWVTSKTNGKINNFFEGPMEPSTRLILLNAVYFKDSWEYPFKEAQTHPDKFYHTKDKWSEVRMMEKTHKFDYTEFTEGQLLKIPYKYHYDYEEDEAKTSRMSNCYQMDMIIYLPAENLEKPKFNLDIIESHIGQLREEQVRLSLPKFKIECKMTLNQALRGLGIEDAFVPGKADLSPINGHHDLFVSKAVQQTFIEVDEKGTEAAAVTGFQMLCMCAPPSKPPKIYTFRVNRPFMFAIRSNSGVNLFTGIVNKL